MVLKAAGDRTISGYGRGGNGGGTRCNLHLASYCVKSAVTMVTVHGNLSVLTNIDTNSLCSNRVSIMK